MDTSSLIRISEMASLHAISRQTLILYDKNGLLKPAYVSDTGYRYYSIEQVPRLRLICFLKEAGISLARIRQTLDDCTPGAMLATMHEREWEIDAQIANLQRQKYNLQQHEPVFVGMEAKLRNADVPFFEHIPQRKALFASYPPDAMDVNKLHLALMNAWDQLTSDGNLGFRCFGSLLRTTAVNAKQPLEGAGSIIILTDEDDGHSSDNLIEIPEGDYVTMYKHAMPYDLVPVRMLLGWIGRHGLKPLGDVVDICLLDGNFHPAAKGDFCRLEVRVG